mgnify:CR=1 FL=1
MFPCAMIDVLHEAIHAFVSSNNSKSVGLNRDACRLSCAWRVHDMPAPILVPVRREVEDDIDTWLWHCFVVDEYVVFPAERQQRNRRSRRHRVADHLDEGDEFFGVDEVEERDRHGCLSE